MKPLQIILAMVAISIACTTHAQYCALRNFASELTGGGTQNSNVMQKGNGLVYLANP